MTAWLATDEGMAVALTAVACFAAIGWSYLGSRSAAQAAQEKNR